MLCPLLQGYVNVNILERGDVWGDVWGDKEKRNVSFGVTFGVTLLTFARGVLWVFSMKKCCFLVKKCTIKGGLFLNLGT